jgi:hypothetical protein
MLLIVTEIRWEYGIATSKVYLNFRVERMFRNYYLQLPFKATSPLSSIL